MEDKDVIICVISVVSVISLISLSLFIHGEIKELKEWIKDKIII